MLAHVGSSFAILGPCCLHLGSNLAILAPTWGHVGTILVLIWLSWLQLGHLGAILSHCNLHFAASWLILSVIGTLKVVKNSSVFEVFQYTPIFRKALALPGRAVLSGAPRRGLTRGQESEEGGERALLREGSAEGPLHFSMFFGGSKILTQTWYP